VDPELVEGVDLAVRNKKADREKESERLEVRHDAHEGMKLVGSQTRCS